MTTPTVVLVAASTNQARLLTAIAEVLRDDAAVVPVLAAAGHRVSSVDSAERALLDLGRPFVVVPFRRIAFTRLLPGRRKFRTPLPPRALVRWLEGLEASVLVVANDSRPTSVALLQAARQVSVPTVLVQDGVRPVPRAGAQATGSRRRSLLPRRLRSYGEGGCDRLALMSDRFASRLVAAGVARESIVMTGFPPYDAYAGGEGHTPASAPPVVLYIAQALGLPPDDVAEHLRAVARAVAAAGASLTVKFHPRDATAPAVQARLARVAPEIRTVGDAPAAPLLEEATLVVTPFSTMALEAMAAGVPVALLDLLPVPWTLDLGAAVPHVTTETQLEEQVRALVSDPAARPRLVAAQRVAFAEETHAEDGGATGRVAALIADLARSHPGVPCPE